MTTPKRNEPCPCGSGKKYRKCCMNVGPAAPARAGGDRRECGEEAVQSFEDLEVVPIDLEGGRPAAEARARLHGARRNLVARPLPGMGFASPMMIIVDADTDEAVGRFCTGGLAMDDLRRAYPGMRRLEDLCLDEVP